MNFIDLFCGCGGFTLGMERSGLSCIGALDNNAEAIRVFQHNFGHVRAALKRDLLSYEPTEFEAELGGQQVDVIIGGPPCQGFSTARQRDGANHGTRLKDDPRRNLYQRYLAYVAHFKPKVFVMENVLGIRTASSGEYFARVQSQARDLGYIVHEQLERCAALGVPQKRRRQLFIGTRTDLTGYFRTELPRPPRAPARPSVREAIGDLPPLEAGAGDEGRAYDLELRERHVHQYGDAYLNGVLEVGRARLLTAHRARSHSPRDLRDFALLREGQSSADAMRRGVEFEFPYSRCNFKDRYTRQDGDGLCSTIVAHLAKDGLMFIHPTQDRSLTPREAARIQSFPDWFEFPVARTHQFRVIGNAVPPLVGEAVGMAVQEFLAGTTSPNRATELVPRSRSEALEWIAPLVAKQGRELYAIPDGEFLRAWAAVAYLYPGLHPDNTTYHGRVIAMDRPCPDDIARLDPRIVNPYYEASGWPVALAPVAREAWRRYRAGQLADGEMYNQSAQRASLGLA